MALSSVAVPILDATIMHEKRGSIAGKLAPCTNIATTLPGGVRILAAHEYKEAAACLAEAFRLDNVVRYAIDTPDRLHLSEEERYELHTASMEYVVYAHILQGLVLTAGENYDCVALWLPPGKNIDDWWTVLRSGLWRMNYRLSKEGKIRFFEEFLPLLSRTKTEGLGDRDEKSWYLNYIGTKPSARGKGYARKLIDYVGNLARLHPLSNDWETAIANNTLRPMLKGFHVISKALTPSTSSSMARWDTNSRRKSTCSDLLRNSD